MTASPSNWFLSEKTRARTASIGPADRSYTAQTVTASRAALAVRAMSESVTTADAEREP